MASDVRHLWRKLVKIWSAVATILGGISTFLTIYVFATGYITLRQVVSGLIGTKFPEILAPQSFIIGPSDEAVIDGVFCGEDVAIIAFCGGVTPDGEEAGWQVALDGPVPTFVSPCIM